MGITQSINIVDKIDPDISNNIIKTTDVDLKPMILETITNNYTSNNTTIKNYNEVLERYIEIPDTNVELIPVVLSGSKYVIKKTK